MTLFPGERPEYPSEKSEGKRIELYLNRGKEFTTASCLYHDGEQAFRGRASVKNEKLTGRVQTDSLCQQILKLAIYRAVLCSGRKKPVWGALTGVRPGKLMSPMLAEGMPEREALRRFEQQYDVSHERALLCLDTSRATLRADRSLRPQDVCLYIGIPFCPTRCAYCSFVSQSTEKSMTLIPGFLAALEQELWAVAEQCQQTGLSVVSAYMGGGTPTTLSAEQMDRLINTVKKAFDLSGLREFTVEAGRPDTVTEEKLHVLRCHGVDRISINPQSMSDSVLKAIGRRHSAEDIVRALEQVRDVGGFTVNMDLIAGLPTDTPKGFRKTVDRVLALEPENITIHTLSIKRGARLHFGENTLPGDAACAEMLEYGISRLRDMNYSPYYLYRQKNMSGGFENIGWTKPGHTGIYNICVMEELHSVLALGAGGVTKLTDLSTGYLERISNKKYPKEYIESIDEICDNKNRMREFYAKMREGGARA